MSTTPPPPREGQRHTQGEVIVCGPRVDDNVTIDYDQQCLLMGPAFKRAGVDYAQIVCICDDEHNAHRLAACWNACLPFPSPATDVPRLIAACKPFLDAADQRADWRCRNPGWNPDAHIEITMRHSELAALLAALPVQSEVRK